MRLPSKMVQNDTTRRFFVLGLASDWGELKRKKYITYSLSWTFGDGTMTNVYYGIEEGNFGGVQISQMGCQNETRRIPLEQHRLGEQVERKKSEFECVRRDWEAVLCFGLLDDYCFHAMQSF